MKFIFCFFGKILSVCGKEVEKGYMSTVKVSEKETIDDAIKRWKKKCQKDNIISDLRRKEHYEKPSVRRKKKKEAAKKRKARAR